MFPTRYQYFYRSPQAGRPTDAAQEQRERDTTRGLLLIAAVVAIPVALMAFVSVLISAG